MLKNNEIDKKRIISILFSLITISAVSFIIYFIVLGLLYKTGRLKENVIVKQENIEKPLEQKAEQSSESSSIENHSLNLKKAKEQLLITIKENSPIYFIEDTVLLRGEEDKKLDKISSAFLNITEIKLLITGHTDRVGNNEEEFDLSQKRALFVKEYFIGKNNKITFNILIEFYGSTKMVYNGIDINQRYLNRRAEIELVEIK